MCVYDSVCLSVCVFVCVYGRAYVCVHALSTTKCFKDYSNTADAV